MNALLNTTATAPVQTLWLARRGVRGFCDYRVASGPDDYTDEPDFVETTVEWALPAGWGYVAEGREHGFRSPTGEYLSLANGSCFIADFEGKPGLVIGDHEWVTFEPAQGHATNSDAFWLETLSDREAAAVALASGSIEIKTAPDGLSHRCTADLDYLHGLNGRNDAGFWRVGKGSKASLHINDATLTDRSSLGIAESAVYAARATYSA